MRAGQGGVGEEPGGLDDDVGTDVGPLQGGRVALGERLDLLVADPDRVVGGRHVGVQPAQDRVELQQVGKDGVVGQVVDADDLDVGTRRTDGAEEVPADPAEPVDPYTNGHWNCSC